MGKFLITFGGICGVVGLFLPLVQVMEKLGYTTRQVSSTLWAGFTASEYTSDSIALALLAAFLLLVLLGLWAFGSWSSRARALVVIAVALPATAVPVYFLVRIVGVGGSVASIGIGLVLLTAGGLLAIAGAVATMIRPDDRPPG